MKWKFLFALLLSTAILAICWIGSGLLKENLIWLSFIPNMFLMAGLFFWVLHVWEIDEQKEPKQ